MNREADSEQKRQERVISKLRTTQDVPVFSQQQINTFNSDYVDSYDEALAILDETNTTPNVENPKE